MVTILTALSYLATLAVGLAGGVFLARHDLRRHLRHTVSAAIAQEEQRLTDAWDTDTDQWQQVASALDFPLHDYRKETS